MQNISYNVRIRKMDVYKGKKVTTYKVRWLVDAREWKNPFRNKTQALNFESELRTAASKGEAFDITTGRPVSWFRTDTAMSWYDFCIAYVDMKWKGASAKHRANTAWALVTVTPAMFNSIRGKPDSQKIRTALRKWAFNSKNRGNCPDDAAHTLQWVARNTKPVSALTDPKVMRDLLTTASVLLDGRTASASTVRRNRSILHNACEYAVEIGLLTVNPVKQIKWKPPRTSAEVDRRSVVNHAQARQLLKSVRQQEPSGPRLAAFFAVIYYAGLRPEEAVSLGKGNVVLPPLVWNEVDRCWKEPPEEDQWGELRFRDASPEVGAEWTDDGATREQRGLKARARGEWRRVPCPPPLTEILRNHLKEHVSDTGGRLFSGVRGGHLPTITYRRSWKGARESTLGKSEYDSPLARRVYDLRHACLSTWLNAGVPATQVAEWAGHSVAVLLKVYAKCVDGQDDANKRRIEAALRI